MTIGVCLNDQSVQLVLTQNHMVSLGSRAREYVYVFLIIYIERFNQALLENGLCDQNNLEEDSLNDPVDQYGKC